MYAVVAEWNGTTAWWGAYPDKETADKVAKRVNGKVVIWNQKVTNDGEGKPTRLT